MATKKASDTPAQDGNTTNSEVNKAVHGFSGDTVEIRLFKAEPGEPVQVFVGVNHYTAVLHREKWIRVPVEVADHLESLSYTVQEADEEHPDDRTKDKWVEKQRFPMQRR